MFSHFAMKSTTMPIGPIQHGGHRKASIQSTFIQSKPQGIKVVKRSLKGAAFYTKA